MELLFYWLYMSFSYILPGVLLFYSFVIENIFKYVSTCNNVMKFVVEEPSLNEIFVAKVGESYEK